MKVGKITNKIIQYKCYLTIQMKMKQNETKNYHTNEKLGKQMRFFKIQIKQYKVLNNHII